MSEENTENDKTKEEKDALSSEPIDFASHECVVLESDNSYVVVSPDRAKMAIKDDKKTVASIGICKKLGDFNEGIFSEIRLQVKRNNSAVVV